MNLDDRDEVSSAERRMREQGIDVDGLKKIIDDIFGFMKTVPPDLIRISKIMAAIEDCANVPESIQGHKVLAAVVPLDSADCKLVVNLFDRMANHADEQKAENDALRKQVASLRAFPMGPTIGDPEILLGDCADPHAAAHETEDRFAAADRDMMARDD